ncbi:MAG: peptidylprolyl isomerase [Pirellulales bacterium]|nr:peptidylprolyl isomerase [Pirellulales bacterium]
MLSELHRIDIQYRTGRWRDRDRLKQRYKQVVDEGKASQQRLMDAATIACAKQPDENRELASFLSGVVYLLIRNEEYEEAVRIGQMLIDNSVARSPMYNACGVAAYAVNEFDLAEQHLLAAKERNALDDVGRSCLQSIPYYKEAWEKEKAIRAAEQSAGDLPRVVLATSQGDMELELFENEAPNTVANFISLVEKGFYDGLTFHRVIHRSRAEGGCPKGDGTDGPGYSIPTECLQADHRLHFRGSLSMIAEGSLTSGSQFYLSFIPDQQRDGKNTVFGRIVRGIDVLARLQRREPRDPMWADINPHGNVVIPPADKIIQARVIRKRQHEYMPMIYRVR